MSILDNEGHDPQGLGNRTSAREVLCACADSCAKDAEIERLRAALNAIENANRDDWEFRNGVVVPKWRLIAKDALDQQITENSK